MKLRTFARQLAAAAVAGAMTLSLCLPALAETWDMSNTEKYPYGESAWISVHRYADNDTHPELSGQFLQILNCNINGKKDNDPVFSGRFEKLDLIGHEGTTANATLQGAHVEYSADSTPTLTATGNAELTLSGSNTVTHTHQKWSAVTIDENSKLTITGSGSLTAKAPANVVFLDYTSTLDVAGGTVSISTTGTTNDGIYSDGGPIQVSGGKLNISGAKYGIATEGGTVLVDGGTLDITATQYGIAPSHGTVQVSSGTLTVSGTVGINDTNFGKVQVDGGTLDAAGSSHGINVDSVLVNNGTLTARASAAENSDNAAVYASDVTVKGGILNVENNAAPYGIFSVNLNVTGGRLAAKGQTVFGRTTVNISGGVVHADKLTSNGSVNLSGGNVTLKTVPTGTVTFSERARLTIEDPVSESDISALVEAFQNVQDTLYDTAYLKYKLVGTNDYVVLRGTKEDPEPGLAVDDTDISDIGSAPAGDVGGAIAAVALGGAAVWGGYEVATRVILHNLLPEGAAIPKTQAQLALLLWDTAGRPEPAGTPAFADVDETTAKAAQWCTEQGYLSGEFRPEKHVAKYNVIRAWAKAFPKAG